MASPSAQQKCWPFWQSLQSKFCDPFYIAMGLTIFSFRFNLSLETRLEYLTLAVSNAKSHPVSVGGRHETAIAFLTDLEEKLDVAQVQLELYNTLLPRQHDAEIAERFKALSYRLYNITEVRTVLLVGTAIFLCALLSQLYQLYADPLDLPLIKLLILHVSDHRDESIVRPIWNRIFEEGKFLPMVIGRRDI